MTHPVGPGPDVREVHLPDGTTTRGVEVRGGLIDIGPAGVRLEMGDRLVVGGRRGVVVGFLRGPRKAVPGLWSAGVGTQVWVEWDDLPSY